MVDESLLAFASERQAEAIKAYIKHGSYAKASKAMGINDSSFANLIKRAKAKAGCLGSVPELGIDKPFPDRGQVASGYSRYFKTEDGGFWIKTKVDDAKYQAIVREAIDELKADLKPIAPIKQGRWEQPEELLNLYVLSDIHIGALSWADETGSNWDLAIAEETIINAFKFLIERSPPSRHGFFCQLGDGLHYDSMRPETPAHRHIVDADSRAAKMVRSAIRIFRQVTNMLLSKHEKVTVLHAAGNHDPFSSLWLQESFAAIYEKNERCDVIVNPAPYYAHKHGKTFLGFHHGHKAKMARVVEVFNGRKFWEMKSDCRMAYLHTGHEHHREVKEFNGGIVEMHQTIAAPSAYEAHGGYEADRSMTCITYHDGGKEQSRTLFYPEFAA